MDQRILVAGASGSLGLELLELLHRDGRQIRALVHSSAGADKVSKFTSDIRMADASKGKDEVRGLTENISIVVSALGKSVSLFTNRGQSFLESDFYANSNILDDALRHDVSRFVYVSIKGAENASDFEIAKSHKMFEDALQASGLDYSVIRPVGFFSGLNDLAIMAKRKVIPIVGDGNAKTNSIHQKDLAKVLFDHLEKGPRVKEVGGPLVHTRLEMAQMIKKKIGARILKIPEKAAQLGMFLPELADRDIAAKLKYFKYVTTHDMIGERNGDITFQEYLNNLNIKDLP